MSGNDLRQEARDRDAAIAAALERWEKWDCNLNGSVGDMIDAGRELARLLRAANPPAGAERAAPKPIPVRRGICINTDYPGSGAEVMKPDWINYNGVMYEPATPAVGEDAGADCECTCASELAEKVRVLLADVARLTEREPCPDIVSAWCSMYDDYKRVQGDKAFVAQDHALRVYARERWGK